ncbi:hypothetical protein CVT25_002940 [Psilocybe cyanescens]|uniref:Tyrosine specific protein phosphatases domain-containing protein n=1 Tax=Psilocybe cyanescens TaxID=93625 RepID=A0A409WN02_PSICY|nr:hypothetical protein CVT25_002940 [Psilocybe cyanescens]
MKSRLQFLKPKAATATTTTTKPNWLAAASSEKHISDVVHLLTIRESARYVARDASRQKALEASEPVPPNKSSISMGPFQRKEEINPKHVEHYAITTGVHEDNQDMNRYIDIIPYDRTRMVIDEGCPPPIGNEEYKGKGHGRYLNANWVLEKYGHKWWIATQAPLRHTAHAFLSVMLQPCVHPPYTSASQPGDSKNSRVRTVVQLTRNVEGGRKKADAYFPSEVGKSIVVLAEHGCHASPLKVTLLEKKTIKDAHCVQSTVSVIPLVEPSHPRSEHLEANSKDEDDDRDCSQGVVFNHLLYLSWPDHGVPAPEDRNSLLEFIQLVDQINRDTSRCAVHPAATPSHVCEELDPDPPIMVGCSAGIGRTGAFLALSSLLREYGFLRPAAHPTIEPAVHNSPLGHISSDLRDDLVLQEIDSLREQRPGMVQRTEQVILVYKLLAAVFGGNTQ